MKISNSDITFVIQGAIDFNSHEGSFVTLELIKSIREFFKTSKIILSTWKGSDITRFSEIENLELVLNSDPGPTSIDDSKPNNFNRMVYSSLCGLRKVSTRFVCKMRTDMLLDSGSMLDVYQRLTNSKYDSEYRLVSSDILTISYSSVNPNTSKQKLLFHPCDWLFLGELVDVLPFFEGITLSNDDANYLARNKIEILDPNYLSRFRAEQMIFLNFLKRRKLNVDFSVYNEYSLEKHELSLKLMVNNLIVVDGDIIGVRSLKHPNISRFTPTKINYLDWRVMSLRYRSENIIISRFLELILKGYGSLLSLGKNIIDKVKGK